MSRVILLVIAVLVFIWLLRRALSARKSGSGKAAAKPAPVAELVACARCGVHLPKAEAVAAEEEGAPGAGRFFCSPEHLKLGPR